MHLRTGHQRIEGEMMMRTRPLAPAIAVATLVLWACTLPGMATPTPIVFPTPNETLTAIFQPTATVPPETVPTLPPPTATPGGPSLTPEPTATLAASAGSTRPNGTPVRAVRLAAPPTIDGDLGEWSSSIFVADQIVFGASNWTGVNDASASYYAGWDDSNLYLAVGVRDDRHVQTATGSKLYLGDDIEIQLDAQLAQDFSSTGLSADDYQIGLSAGNFGGLAPEAYRWYPSSLAGRLTAAVVKAKASGDGYILEAQIPWSALGVTPNSGASYGFAVSISDNDKTGVAAQQSMVSSVSTRKLLNPGTWGTLILEGESGK
jgi:hypothetical protein